MVTAEIAGQAERIAALEAMIAGLRDQLPSAVRAGSRNSGNSSMAPSSDDLPGRKPPRKQRRAAERADKKRNRGKQPGSPGAAMRWGAADRTENHYPEGACSCGENLAGAVDLGVSRSYQPAQSQVRMVLAGRVRQERAERRHVTGDRLHGQAAFRGQVAGIPGEQGIRRHGGRDWPGGRGRPDAAQVLQQRRQRPDPQQDVPPRCPAVREECPPCRLAQRGSARPLASSHRLTCASRRAWITTTLGA
jgi:Family of unknown function (DUF6444)